MLNCLLQGNTVPVELEGKISVHSIAMHFSKETARCLVCSLSLWNFWIDIAGYSVAFPYLSKHFFHLCSSVFYAFVFCCTVASKSLETRGFF